MGYGVYQTPKKYKVKEKKKMELAMKNGFCEISVCEMELIDGGKSGNSGGSGFMTKVGIAGLIYDFGCGVIEGFKEAMKNDK